MHSGQNSICDYRSVAGYLREGEIPQCSQSLSITNLIESTKLMKTYFIFSGAHFFSSSHKKKIVNPRDLCNILQSKDECHLYMTHNLAIYPRTPKISPVSISFQKSQHHYQSLQRSKNAQIETAKHIPLFKHKKYNIVFTQINATLCSQ